MVKTKEEIRTAINACRKKIDPRKRATASIMAARQLEEVEDFKTARIVSVYLSLPWEIDTDNIVLFCRNEGKILCVPAFDDERGEYRMAEYRDGMEMREGNCGTREPRFPEWVKSLKVDIFVIPGLAFGRRGERIGHGGGHYDRILSREHKNDALKLGLAYDFQVFDILPQEPYDMRVDMVVTESRVIHCR